MVQAGIAGFLLILANIIFSYFGLKNSVFFDGYEFETDKILVNKDYKRLITSGFLHVSWQHLIFNMISLYFFCGLIEIAEGELKFLIIYFGALIGGNLLALIVHRNHGDYSAAGASGAVCGVIFASLALFPGMSIRIFMIPIDIPGWLYGIIYVGYSIYGIRSKTDNIGHEAHLGGALAGMLIAMIMEPYTIAQNYITVLVISIPAIIFIYLIIKKPHFLLIDNLYFKTHNNNLTIDQHYNLSKKSKQAEIDKILDKINRKGISSLTSKEKKLLDEYSGSL